MDDWIEQSASVLKLERFKNLHGAVRNHFLPIVWSTTLRVVVLRGLLIFSQIHLMTSVIGELWKDGSSKGSNPNSENLKRMELLILKSV